MKILGQRPFIVLEGSEDFLLVNKMGTGNDFAHALLSVELEVVLDV